MSEIYDNYEQSQRVQNWLKENGGAIILGIVVALAAVYGVRYWDNNMQNKHIAAASEYRSLIIALEAGNIDVALVYPHQGRVFTSASALHRRRNHHTRHRGGNSIVNRADDHRLRAATAGSRHTDSIWIGIFQLE